MSDMDSLRSSFYHQPQRPVKGSGRKQKGRTEGLTWRRYGKAVPLKSEQVLRSFRAARAELDAT